MASYRNNKGWSAPSNPPKYMRGAAGFAGGIASFRDLKARLRTMATTVAHDVAQQAAPALTAAAVASYNAGQTVYGATRPQGVNGNQLTLNKSGDTLSTLRFVANGTIVRVVLGTKYARYLIGKYAILPNGSAAIPPAWRRTLEDITAGAVRL